jgi:hypothetical protein
MSRLILCQFSTLRTGRCTMLLGLLGLLACVPLGGCGSDGPGRHALYGKISGAEEKKGSITFVPLGEPPRPSATTAIADGRYEFGSDTGPCSGPHRVLVRLDEAPGQAAAPSEQPEAGSDKILQIDRQQRRVTFQPPSFVEKTVEVEVPEDGPWELDIHLP